MVWMKYDYLEYPMDQPAFPDLKKIYRPIIRISIKYQSELDLLAYLDSGSDFCLFPAEVGELIGIDSKSGIASSVTGVGGQECPVYYHSVEIAIGGHKKKIKAGFGEFITIPLLGQIGFFDNFKVKFDFAKKRLEIEPY